MSYKDSTPAEAIMKCSILFLVSAVLTLSTVCADDALPLHPEDAAVLRKVAEREHLDAPPDAKPQGWPLQKGDKGVRFASKENPKHALTVVYNDKGRVIKYLGNGPILSNASMAEIAALPELLVIRIDHNIPGPGSKTPQELYDGSGFAALVNSKLEEVKIGHAFDDKGMAALAGIRTIKAMHIGHSKVTDQGLQALEKHPSLEVFHISSQGRAGRVTDKCLAVFATLPKLKELGLHETFVTYDGGLKPLAATKAPLALLSLKGSLVLPADVEKLKKVLPTLSVETSTPAELLEAPNSRGVAKWASPEAQAYLKLGEKK
jgi:hypothetical protein